MLSLLRTLFLSFSLMAGSAFAATQAYDPATFDALLKEGTPTVVVIHAEWCPICKAQGPLLEALAQSPEMRTVHFLMVDFDKHKNALKRVRATMQSTLIVYKGGQEVGRSTGDTHKDSIAALLRQAL